MTPVQSYVPRSSGQAIGKRIQFCCQDVGRGDVGVIAVGFIIRSQSDEKTQRVLMTVEIAMIASSALKETLTAP